MPSRPIRDRVLVGGGLALLVAALIGPLASPSVSPAQSELRSVAVTLVDEDAVPEFAGLGRLAYVEDGRVHIVDGFQGARSRLDGFGGATRLAWSGDGSMLAMEVGSRLYLYRYGDTRVQWMPDEIARWEWAPQGAVLAWNAADAPNSIFGSGLNVTTFGPDGPATTALVTGIEVSDFVWSPQQRLAYLTFERKPPGTNPTEFHALFTTGVTPGATPQRLTLLPAGRYGFVQLAAFTLDGRNLLFWDNPLSSGSIAADGLPLMSVPVDGGTPEPLGRTLVRKSWVAQGASGRIEIVGGGGRDSLQRRSLLACVGAACSDTTDPAVSELDPAWSSDGRVLAFVRGDVTRAPGLSGSDNLERYRTRTLWVGAVGGQSVEIPGAGVGVAEPRWALDGRHLVILRDHQLWLVDVRGGDAIPLSGALGSGGNEPFPAEGAAYEASDQYRDILQAGAVSSWFQGSGTTSVSAQPRFTG